MMRSTILMRSWMNMRDNITGPYFDRTSLVEYIVEQNRYAVG